jgi:hypothetical protein
MIAAATGRLIAKISRQDTAWTSHPPRNGPIAVATPDSPDQAPIALPRSAGRNDASMMARLPGVSSAAPTPCRARAAIRNAEPAANPHSSEDSANHVTPVRKIRFRPYRSPSVPANSSSPARASVYAVTTH